MHLGKFHAAVTQIVREYKGMGVASQLMSVINLLDSVSNNPGNTEIAQSFQNQVKGLKGVLMNSDFNTPRPTLAMLVDAMGASDFVGQRLFKRVEDVIQQNSMTPQLAAVRLRELYAAIEKFYNNLFAVDSAFTEMEVEYEKLDFGEGELAISIPEPVRPRLLSDLAATAKDWNQALSPFVELVDPEHNPIEVTTISSSDWQFYLTAAPQVLLAVSTIVSQVNELLVQLVETKRLINQLISTGISEEATNIVSQQADMRMDTRSREIAEQLVDSNPPPDVGRANELKISITRSVKFIAKEMSENVTIEVRYIPPETATDGVQDNAEIQKIEALTKAAEQISRNMSFVPLDGTAAKLLNLPAPPDAN